MRAPRAAAALIAIVAIAATLGSLAACNTGVGPDPKTSVIVFGSVFDTTGTRVAGASVTAIAFTDSCGAGFFAADVATTDTTGHYRARPTALGDSTLTCLVVRVSPAFGTHVDSSFVNGVVLRPGAPDSVRVDVIVH